MVNLKRFYRHVQFLCICQVLVTHHSIPEFFFRDLISNSYLWPILKKFQRHISIFLLAALSLFITPKELLHEFSSHLDTTDKEHSAACAGHISTHHQHCDVLQLHTVSFARSVLDRYNPEHFVVLCPDCHMKAHA